MIKVAGPTGVEGGPVDDMMRGDTKGMGDEMEELGEGSIRMAFLAAYSHWMSRSTIEDQAVRQVPHRVGEMTGMIRMMMDERRKEGKEDEGDEGEEEEDEMRFRESEE